MKGCRPHIGYNGYRKRTKKRALVINTKAAHIGYNGYRKTTEKMDPLSAMAHCRCQTNPITVFTLTMSFIWTRHLVCITYGQIT